MLNRINDLGLKRYEFHAITKILICDIDILGVFNSFVERDERDRQRQRERDRKGGREKDEEERGVEKEIQRQAEREGERENERERDL